MPYKTWLVLREDVKFSSNKLIQLTALSTNNISHNRAGWIKDGCIMNTYLIFNLQFLDKLEEYLINNGILYNLIYDYNTVVGILIEPCIENFKETILSDCMSLQEYSENRLKEFNELSEKLRLN